MIIFSKSNTFKHGKITCFKAIFLNFIKRTCKDLNLKGFKRLMGFFRAKYGGGKPKEHFKALKNGGSFLIFDIKG